MYGRSMVVILTGRFLMLRRPRSPQHLCGRQLNFNTHLQCRSSLWGILVARWIGRHPVDACCCSAITRYPPPFFFPTSTPGLHLSRSLSFVFFSNSVFTCLLQTCGCCTRHNRSTPPAPLPLTK